MFTSLDYQYIKLIIKLHERLFYSIMASKLANFKWNQKVSKLKNQIIMITLNQNNHIKFPHQNQRKLTNQKVDNSYKKKDKY